MASSRCVALWSSRGSGTYPTRHRCRLPLASREDRVCSRSLRSCLEYRQRHRQLTPRRLMPSTLSAYPQVISSRLASFRVVNSAVSAAHADFRAWFDSRQLHQGKLVKAKSLGQLSFSLHLSLPVMYSSCGALGAYSLLAATGTLRFCHDGEASTGPAIHEAASAASSN
jgi:hypothetical protein